MNRNFGMSAGLLAILGLVFHLSPIGSEKTPDGSKTVAEKPGKEKAAEKPDSDNPYFEAPWIATWSLWGATRPSEAVIPNDSKDTTEAGTMPEANIRQRFSLPAGASVYAILAIVPDPLHSRLALFADGSLDAIEAAAGAQGWVFASQWLPWTDPVDSGAKDPSIRRKQRHFARDQENQPGLLVFRRAVLNNAFDHKILLVFLVGETLTSGVSQAQFKNARSYMKALQTERQEQVSIQGPSFSGSFYSLHELLVEDGGKSYFIRTGTATSDKDARALKNSSNIAIDFRATGMDAKDFNDYLLKTVQSLNLSKDAAALLVEDESAFGNAVAKASEFRKFRFPREISQLRNAYRETKPSTSDRTLPPEIDFTLKDSDVSEDSIPTFSRVQTPLAQDAMLDGIMSAIRRDRVRIVQVVATNVLDFLFLARVIQKECPDTRILAADASLLLVEAARTEGLAGILTLSSYPMFPESNWWSDPTDPVIPFPSDVAMGVYNAASMVLVQALPSSARTLVDYGWESSKQVNPKHPPVWLLTLDREGFLPMRLWQHTPCEEPNDNWWATGQSNGRPPVLPSSPSHTWSFGASVVGLAGAGLMTWSVLLWCSDRRRPTLLWDGRLALYSLNDADRWRRFYLACLFLLMGLALVILFAPWTSQRLHHYDLGLAEAGLLAIFALRAVSVRPSALLTVKQLAPLGAALMALLLTLAGAWLWVSCCRDDDDLSGLFFSLRAIELRVGSSPAIPVLAALSTLMAFCILHLTRIYLVACKEPEVTLDLESAFRCRLREAHGKITRHLSSAFGLVACSEWAAFGGAALLAFTLGFACKPYQHLSSTNPWSYNVLLICLQCCSFLAILHAAIQMTLLWGDLKSFLLSLGALPLATAFLARNRSQSNRPIWVRSINVQSVSMLVRGTMILHDLTLLRSGRLADGLREMIEEHRGDVKRLIEPPRNIEGRLDILNRYRKIRSHNANVVARLFNEIVLPYWSTTPLVGAMDRSNPSEANEKDPPGQVGIPGDPKNQGDLAQTYVALHYSSFLLYIVQQVRNLSIFLSMGFVLLAVSLTCYAPQSPRTVSRFLLVIFIFLAVVLWRILTGIERDPILSRIEGTKAGELNAEFYLKLVGYGAIPLIGLLATQFPAISNFLFSWIEPTLEALR